MVRHSPIIILSRWSIHLFIHPSIHGYRHDGESALDRARYHEPSYNAFNHWVCMCQQLVG
jgi:hypothetical protein